MSPSPIMLFPHLHEDASEMENNGNGSSFYTMTTEIREEDEKSGGEEGRTRDLNTLSPPISTISSLVVQPGGSSVSPPPVLAPLDGVSSYQPKNHICWDCFTPILDRYIVYFNDQPYHATCLRCTACHCDLSEHDTAFIRNNSIFCRRDYLLFTNLSDIHYSGHLLEPSSCFTCNAPLHFTDIVVRTGNVICHVDCCVCYVCRRHLFAGDMCVVDNKNHTIYCRAHFDMMIPCREDESSSPPPHTSLPALGALSSHPPLLPHLQQTIDPVDVALMQCVSKPPSMSTAISPEEKKEDSVSTDEFDGDDGGMNCSQSSSIHSGSKSKRMRTSFKHHQLRTMKNYFNLNHNPDAKDLKQLAQKTGLTKRVLQVWFQNARAKYRRSIAGRDPSSVSPSLGGGGSILPPVIQHGAGQSDVAYY